MRKIDVVVSSESNKKLKPLAISNSNLIGYWQHVGSNQVFRIANNSFYYIVSDPAPYSISNNQLDWDGWIFDLVLGSGTEVHGVWRDPNTNEEVYFRSDMSYTWHDPSGFETFGIYALETNPDKLGTTEARAYLTENGNQLTFNSIYSGTFTYDFTVSVTELVLTDPENGNEIRYNRI